MAQAPDPRTLDLEALGQGCLREREQAVDPGPTRQGAERLLPVPRRGAGEPTRDYLRRLWETAARETDDAVVGVDADGRVRSWSPTAERLFGWSDPDVVGCESALLFADADPGAHANRLRRALLGERLRSVPLVARRSDGNLFPVSVTVMAFGDREGVCLLVRDTSEQQFSQLALAEAEERLLETQQLAQVGLWVWDSSTDTFQMSLGLHAIHGVEPADFRGTLSGFLARVHDDDREDVRNEMHRALTTRTAFEGQHRVVRPSGEVRWVYARATLEADPTGEAVGLRGICQDITASKLTEELLRRQATFTSLLHGIAVAANEASTLQEALRSCVDELCSHAGWSVGHAYVVQDRQATSSGIWQAADSALLSRFRAAMGSVPEGGEADLVEQVLAGGAPVWISDVGRYVGSRRLRAASRAGLSTAFAFPVVVQGEIVAVLEFFSAERRETDQQLIDTTEHGGNQLGRVVERARLREALARHALHDALTDLPNRTLLMDRLVRAVHRLERDDTSLAVVFLDIDDFKLINDSLGHHVGDSVLTSISRRLSRVMRPGDTLARFGGDEFVVLCEHVEHEQAVTEIVDRLLAVISRPLVLPGGLDVVVRASAGIALAREARAVPEDLIRDADSAMYQAKEQGGDRWQAFDPGIHQRASRRLVVANELRRALELGQLEVHYQPQVRIEDRVPVALEALLRWRHPERGLLSPVEFVDVAEETQLIVPIGAWVLREACRHVAMWCRPATAGRDFSVSVNVSALQLGRSDFITSVSEALTEHHLDPRHLCLEITESILMTDAEETVSALHALKELGVRLAVDDFGTGYSSLAYLSRFPIDVLKIDKAFVDGLGTGSARPRAILQAVVDLAHALGVRPVAEGVERVEQVRDLKAIGCEIAQGFYFSHPLPASALGTLLRTRAGGD